MRRKRFMRKAAAAMAGLMLMTGLVGGCGKETADPSAENAASGGESAENSGAESGEKVKVRMITYLGNPTRDQLIMDMVKDLDGIELEIISPPPEQAGQKIETMLQTGGEIDIVELNAVPATYIANGYLQSLDEYVKDWEDWATVTDFLKEQVSSYDGSIYSIPYGVYERALFYRKDWFEERGFEVPKTWDELYEIAVAFTDPAQNRYGYSFRGGLYTTGYAQMTILSFMPEELIDIATPGISTEGKCNYSYPEAVEALEFYQKLFQDGSSPDAINWGYVEMVEAFYSGITAMLIQDPEVVQTCEEYMEEGTWDVAPLPTGPSGRALFPAGFAGWGIPAASKNKDAAWKVIELLSSVEGNTYFAKKNGNIPIHTTAQEDPFFSEGYYKCYVEMVAQPDKYVGYVDGGESVFMTKEEMDSSSAGGAGVETAIQEMLLGKRTPEDVAKEMQKGYEWLEDSEWVKERINNR